MVSASIETWQNEWAVEMHQSPARLGYGARMQAARLARVSDGPVGPSGATPRPAGDFRYSLTLVLSYQGACTRLKDRRSPQFSRHRHPASRGGSGN